jgi:hypothetical protein
MKILSPETLNAMKNSSTGKKSDRNFIDAARCAPGIGDAVSYNEVPGNGISRAVP